MQNEDTQSGTGGSQTPGQTDRDHRQAERDRTRLAEEILRLEENLEHQQQRTEELQEQLQAAEDQEQQRSSMETFLATAVMKDSFPTFTGDPCSSKPFSEFIIDFEIACQGVGLVEEEKKARFLSTRLQGHALEIYKIKVQGDNGLRTKFTELTAALKAYFDTLAGGRRVGTTAFYNRKQLAGESVVSYYDELIKLSKHAYPGEEEMPGNQFLERFLRGLNGYIKAKVIAKDPKTSQAALEAACNAEANKMYLDEDRDAGLAVAAINAINKESLIEDKLTALTSQVNQLSTRLQQEHPYSYQQRQAQQQPRQQERWPEPQHHFPQPPANFQQRRFQPAPPRHGFRNMPRPPSNFRNGGRLPNYNQEGQPRCFRCNRYGHMISSCRERTNPNNKQYGTQAKARIRQLTNAPGFLPDRDEVEYQDTSDVRSTVESREEGNTSQASGRQSRESGRNTDSNGNTGSRSTTSGGMKPGYSYLYVAMISLVCYTIPTADAQRAMICDTTSPGQLFALPQPRDCNYTIEDNSQLPSSVTYRVYKYNHVQYDVGGYLCRKNSQKLRLLTWFFNDEHERESSSEELPVTVTQCKSMVETKMTPDGTLTQQSTGVWATSNKMEWRQPRGGLPECCHWVEYSVTNWYLVPVRIYKQHGQPDFSCNGADVSSCDSYFSNYCQLDKQALVWQANLQAKCKYLFYKEIKGRQLLNSWLADDGQIALTTVDKRTVEDCGLTLNLADQGLTFTVVSNTTKAKRETRNLFQENADSFVLSTELAAELQALYDRVREEISYAYHHNWRMACDNMRNTAITWRTTALSQPTEAVRTMLKDNLLFSKARNGFLEVWKCLAIPKGDFKLLAQADHCTEEIPIQFQLFNKTQNGYLDPLTMVISHYGKPTDCALVVRTPVQLLGRLYIYNRTGGKLARTGSVGKLLPLSHTPASNHEGLMTPFIFKPVNMYSWQELRPTDHINALLQAAAAQTEILSLMGAQVHVGDKEGATQAADVLSTNILSRGLASFLLTLKNPFHIWVLIMNILVLLFMVYKLWRKFSPRVKHYTINRLYRHKPQSADVNIDDMEMVEVDNSEEMEPLNTVIQRSLENTVTVSNLVTGDGDHEHSIIILAAVEDQVGRFLFDSGSSLSLISKKMARRLGVHVRPLTCPTAVSVTGEKIKLLGETELKLCVGDFTMQHIFRIFDGCEQDGILGYDCIKKWGTIMLDPAGRRLKIGHRFIPLEHSKTPPLSVTALENQFLPARSMAIVYTSTSIPIKPGQPLLFEQDLEKGDQFISPRILVAASHRMPIRVVNPANHPIIIYANQKLGYVEATSQICSSSTSNTNTRVMDEDPLSDLKLDDSELTWKERDELTALLLKYKHLFAKKDSDLPGTNVIKHSIKLTDETPIRQKAYRVPVSVREELDAKLDDLLHAGIISPSCSPFSSPLVIVKKSDGSIRPCVDLRKVNEVTIADSFPLPRVDESMEFLSGAKYLTTLDLYSGFLQVPLEDDSKQYTAFITQKGLFHYNYLPFGARNSPATFSRLMLFVLSGLHFQSCILYLDDILCASKTWEDHLRHLEEILQRLDHYNLRLKMKKCCFARAELPFLGFLVSREGVMPDPSNTAKIKQYKSPKTVTQTRSFLGFANYYRRFIKDFGTIAKPLYTLTKKATKFHWSPECEEAFQTLKKMVVSAELLVYPDFSKPFMISTDASGVGCGAILSQMVDGRDRPIAYYSKKFTAAERRYSTVECELLSVYAAVRNWVHYLYGHKVYIYSDQRSLSWGIKQCDSPRMMKWIAKLSDFTDLKIFYRKGSHNKPADFLSRMHTHTEDDELLFESKPTATPQVRELYLLQQGDGTADYFLKEQQKDPKLRLVREYLTTGDPVANKETIKLAMSYEIMQGNGCLIRTDTSGRQQFIVPEHLQGRILAEMHDHTWGAHLGVTRTYEKITQKYYWQGLRESIIHWISSCEGCLTRKSPTHPIKQPMKPINADAPWQNVVIDLVGPLPRSSRGNKWILTMQDRFTKWVECSPLRNATAVTVAREFIKYVITRHGVPLTVSSDQGRQFTSKLFSELSRMLGMKQQLSSAYRPQSCGQIERWHRVMAEMLRQFVATNQTDWCQYLDLVMMAYRTSVHSSTGYTPFQLLHGREARLPTHLLTPDLEQLWTGEEEYINNLHSKIKMSFDAAREKNLIASATQKKYHDRQVNPSKLEVGERVYLQRPTPAEGLSPKLQPRFKGPFIITVILGSNALISTTAAHKTKPVWVHLNHLRRAIPRQIPEYDYEREELPPLVRITPEDRIDAAEKPHVEETVVEETDVAADGLDRHKGRSQIKIEMFDGDAEAGGDENVNTPTQLPEEIKSDDSETDDNDSDSSQPRRYFLRSRFN